MHKGRRNVHMIWLAIVVAGATTSFFVGSYAVGYVMTQLAWQNHRGDEFGEVKAAISLLTRNDLTAYHRFSQARLRDGVIHLAVEDGNWQCSDNQRRTLSHARAWFTEHPDRTPVYAPLERIVERGWNACDTP